MKKKYTVKDLTSGVLIDNSLKKYNDYEPFPEKLAKANEMLKKYGLPKEVEEELAKRKK